ncbi:MAG: TRAP transporter small permease [Halomonas sp.]|nr:MAG: TRAP transporter small permease [Halomonas sp.]
MTQKRSFRTSTLEFPSDQHRRDRQITGPAADKEGIPMSKLIVGTIDRLCRIGAYLACAILVGMVGLIAYEIFLRSVFSTSTFVMSEFVGYGVASATFLALADALRTGDVIRVGLLLERTQGLARRLLEVVAALVGLASVTVLIWFFWLRVIRAWTRGTVSSSLAEVPIWIPEGIIMVGLGLLALQLIAHVLRQIAPVAAREVT